MERLETGDPRWIGGYRLLGRLGEGGMGRVYLARSERGRTVAVKAVRSELARQPDFRRRFAQEITAAQRVGATWTAPVLDADTEATEPWVATGYIAGPSLTEVVDRDYGPLPDHSVRALATGLVKALTAIHAAGLVHRDLKPSNVLITIDGPRVIDFGIARALDATVQSSGGLTRTGAVIGSPGFMSPEQVRGETVTTAADVFCLGAVLAYAATGRMPFGTADSGVHALLFRIAEEEPDLGGLSGPLYELITACLAKSPAQRPTLEQLTARTDGQITGTWLPGEVLAQLGRHAVQLLDSEDPEAQAATAAGPLGFPGGTGNGDGNANGSGSGTGSGAGNGTGGAPATPPPSSPYHSAYHSPPPPSHGVPATPSSYQPGPYGYPQRPWPGQSGVAPTGYQPVNAYGGRPGAGGPRVQSPRSLATPTWALLAVTLVWMVAHFFYVAHIDSTLDDLPTTYSPRDHSDFSGMRNVSQLLDALGLVIILPTALLWVLWFGRLRTNAEAFAPGRLRYEPGLAYGVWFIPVCNFFMPKQIANDIWSASRPVPPGAWYGGGKAPAQRGLLNGWWCTWVGWFFLSFLGSWENWYDDPTVEGAGETLSVAILGDLLGIACGILAILLVLRLTRLQDDRIAGRV
ncbi:DUF4328 domain-containing protein [Streptomyces sp. Z26]|uniref:protein kinase domain-containing protein n=1 Tax=Streptomyces TaxID=1883 RepID=UPI000EF155E9|nr:DUF4328 domain-containing protein [Streptomyces sp. Z26]RLL67666.1 DUF4328 domain-containing protein [Streptomyces sp. Z26]